MVNYNYRCCDSEFSKSVNIYLMCNFMHNLFDSRIRYLYDCRSDGVISFFAIGEEDQILGVSNSL